MINDLPGGRKIQTTDLGHVIFGYPGVDPFMEHPSTAWLIHWNLCGRAAKTTWFWAFHHYPSISFERESLIQGMQRLAEERGWSRASLATIKRDVSCFIRTYVSQTPSGTGSFEDGLESPLTELGLIKPTGRRDGFRFVRGPKPTLGIGVFGHAVTDFWNRSFSGTNTLSFEALSHEPGSPGRAFLLEENDLADKLVALEEFSRGHYRWSETAGLKQLIRSAPPAPKDSLEWLKKDYMDYGQLELSRAIGR